MEIRKEMVKCYKFSYDTFALTLCAFILFDVFIPIFLHYRYPGYLHTYEMQYSLSSPCTFTSFSFFHCYFIKKSLLVIASRGREETFAGVQGVAGTQGMASSFP
jgi:hypothetical protein